MKGLGIVILLVGACWAVFALNMDVSVATGDGSRVNNLGLMADRQIHTILGGIIALAGLLMVLLGGRSAVVHTTECDLRPCPLCAEPIKNAAVKCKHCGADVQAAQIPRLKNGWVTSVPCLEGAEQERTIEAIKKLGLPVVPMMGTAIGAGPFKTKDEAKQVLTVLREEHRLFSEVMYRDSVTGKYPPITD